MRRAAKSIPVPSPHLAVQEEREKRGKKDNGTYSLGSRSAPRMTLASNVFPDADMYVNREGKVVSRNSDSESEGQASSSPSDGRQQYIAQRTARKTLSKSVSKRKLAFEDRPDEQPPLGASKRESDDSSAESDGAYSDIVKPGESFSEKDINKLLDAFDALTLSTDRLKQYKRLPFLLRNLRVGFESRCRTFGVPTDPDKFPSVPVEVVYRHFMVDDSDGENSDESASVQELKYQGFTGLITEWQCPMCQLHKPFKNELMLAFHLAKDHAEVKVSWVLGRSLKDQTLRRIDLVIPNVDQSEDDSSENENSSDEESDESRSPL